MSFNRGDKVKLEAFSDTEARAAGVATMDERLNGDTKGNWVGRTVTVAHVSIKYFEFEEDGGHWCWPRHAAQSAIYVPAARPAPNVCEEANIIAGGDRQRQRDYGHPLDNHRRIADLWNAYIKGRKDPAAPLSEIDAGLMMILLKVAREQNTPKRDNLVDICGYAKCIESMYSEIERRKGGVA